MQILQQLIQGLSLGSIYGLVALGYVLIYQAWGVLNFAQGEVCAIGAFSLLVLHVELGMPIILAMPLAIVVSMIVGYIIEFLSFRPLENAKDMSKLIATIGVSICVRNLLRVIFGADAFAFPSIFGDKPFHVGGLILVPQNLWNTVFGFGLVILLNLFLKKTRVGKSMRATAQDKEAARLMGINVRASLTGTFVIASAIGAVAGMLLAPVYLFKPASVPPSEQRGMQRPFSAAWISPAAPWWAASSSVLPSVWPLPLVPLRISRPSHTLYCSWC